MKARWSLALVWLIASSVAIATKPDCPKRLAQPEGVPDGFLEKVDGKQAMAWVRDHNTPTLDHLSQDSRFDPIRQKALALLEASDQIPFAVFGDDSVFNFWKDATHRRGLLRRTTLEQYKKEEPQWEQLLDVDELAEKEDKNWVYHGMMRLKNSERGLLFLSNGGSDAKVIREFDLKKKAFVEDGFEIPEAKTNVTWLNQDELVVGTDFGEDSLTEAGYPRSYRIWKRGTPLNQALTLFEGEKTDAYVSVTKLNGLQGGPRLIFRRMLTFYESKSFIWKEGSKPVPLHIPDDSDLVDTIGGKILLQLRSEWDTGDQVFPQGSVVEVDVEMAAKQAQGSVTLVFAPSKTMAIEEVASSKSAIYVSVLDDVIGKVLRFTKNDGSWKSEELALGEFGSTGITSVSQNDDSAFLTFYSFLQPTTFYLCQNGVVEKIKELPPRFDADKYEVSQQFATSSDGTQVPYFLVGPKGFTRNSENPTLLYAYGGFEISQTPHYSPVLEYAWLSQGGVYALANIRGGGEYGPAWHQAALKEKRQRAFDDFYAVAEDLIKHKVTQPSRLGIQGGSNGGLLMGVALTQRPDLFNAVLIQVPLLDMLRYHLLLAGASWIGEYGDPRIESEASFIRAYSPYQNVWPGQDYPQPFFMTSTKDDRVHPGHARRMAKKMEDLGYPVYYFENIEGGHGGAANKPQQAVMAALKFTYLWQRLGNPIRKKERETE